MATITESRHNLCWFISEASNTRSRDVGVLAELEVLETGTILGEDTTTGEYKSYNKDATDGSETAIAILWSGEDTTTGAKDVTVLVRDAEVNGKELMYQDGLLDAEKQIVNTQLEEVGIIVR